MSNWERMEQRLARIKCPCDRERGIMHVVRIVGGNPYEPGGVGISIWACETCAPLKFEAIQTTFENAYYIRKNVDKDVNVDA